MERRTESRIQSRTNERFFDCITDFIFLEDVAVCSPVVAHERPTMERSAREPK